MADPNTAPQPLERTPATQGQAAAIAGTVGGGFAGMLMVAFSKLLEDGTPKDLLLLSVPIISLGIASVGRFLHRAIAIWLADKQIEWSEAEMRRKLRAVEADPDASPAHRQAMRQKIEHMELERMAQLTRSIEKAAQIYLLDSATSPPVRGSKTSESKQ